MSVCVCVCVCVCTLAVWKSVSSLEMRGSACRQNCFRPWLCLLLMSSPVASLMPLLNCRRSTASRSSDTERGGGGGGGGVKQVLRLCV